MIKRGFVFAMVVFTLSCSTKNKERKIAVDTTTETNTPKSTVKTTSAVELEHQFKGCKAHW